jgi:DNA-binding MarR family transcriptional regulator
MATMRAAHGEAPRVATEQLIVDMLHDATLTVRARLRTELGPAGLTITQFWLLHRIIEERSTTAGQLAAIEGLTPGTVSVTVDQLVREGMVVRKPAATDRRVVSLAASPKGEASVEGVWNRLGRLFSEVGREIPRSDFEAMFRVLRAIQNSPESAARAPGGVPRA